MGALLFVAALALLARGDLSAQTVRDLIGTEFEIRTIAVVDGDTIEAIPAGDKRAIRLRLDGVDTPERGESFYQQATNLTRVLLFDQTARAEGRSLDRYGRLVARIRIEGKDASVELLRSGLACHYREYSSDIALARAENDARMAGRGFWAPAAPKPKCANSTEAPAHETQARSSSAQSQTIVHGNTQSKLYHASYCPNFNCRSCTRVFQSEEEASNAGYRPAGDCIARR